MKKKIIFIFMAILIFYMPLAQEQQKVEAVAVASKVVNASAKKVAKEAIKDTAVQMSMEFAMNYKYVPKDQRKPKAGFEMICMPKNKKPDGDCSAPMEVKKVTAADKVLIKNKAEQVLESKIAGGVTATKWGKFLDWFLPIFILGLAVSVIDYALDGSVSDMFDDIAMETLKSLGFLTPSTNSAPPMVIEPDPSSPNPETGLPIPPEELPVLKLKIPNGWSVSSATSHERYTEATIILEPKDTSIQYEYQQKGYPYKSLVDKIFFTLKSPGHIKSNSSMTLTHISVSYLAYGSISSHVIQEQPLSTFVTVKKPPSWESLPMSQNEIINGLNGYTTIPQISIKGETPVEVPPIPEFNQLDLPRTNPSGTKIPMVAPGGLPYTKTDTGETALPYAKPDGTPGWKTKTGVEIPEDNVSVGEPVITVQPDGSEIVKKQPTVETPVPSPGDDGIIPPKTPVPVDGEFPDGPSCDAELKLPRLLPLFTQISETFPFSIPWDLKSGFDAIFLKMGSEKPEFEYKLAFQGQEHDFSFKIPSFFDNWMPFIHSILLLTFDIGIVYAIYRFMKGGSG